MSFVCRKPRSPYWMVKFRDASNRIVMRSTKQTEKNAAKKVAWEWEDAAKKARARELTEAASVKVLQSLMEVSTGQTLKFPSIKETLDGYLDNCKKTGAKPSTLIRYNPIFTRFLAHIGSVRSKATVSSLTAREVEEWRNSELASGITAKTANMSLNVLKAAFNAAKRRGEMLHNPCEAVTLLKEMSDNREPFSDAEVVQLLRASKGSDWQGAVMVAVWTGLRLSDVASLTWDKVNLETRNITTVTEKTDKRLEVVIAEELYELLQTLPSGIGRAPLFPNLSGRITGRNGGLSNEFKRLMGKAGIVIPQGVAKKGKGRQSTLKSFHSFRHTFISRLANGDVSSDVRKAMVGHSTDAAHERYVHLSPEKQFEATRKLARFGGWRD